MSDLWVLWREIRQTDPRQPAVVHLLFIGAGLSMGALFLLSLLVSEYRISRRLRQMQ